MFGLARFSTLLLALLIASPALWSAFIPHTLSAQTALIRVLIALPVAAVMLAVMRAVTRDYGRHQARHAHGSVRADAVAGQPFPQHGGEPTTPRAGAPSSSPPPHSGEILPHRRVEDQPLPPS